VFDSEEKKNTFKMIGSSDKREELYYSALPYKIVCASSKAYPSSVSLPYIKS